MGQTRRIVLLVAIALAILAPFGAMGFGILRTDGKGSPVLAQFGGDKSTAPKDVKNHPTAPILATGNEDSLWILQPALGDGKIKCFQLWVHDAGQKTDGKEDWTVLGNGTDPNLPGLPSQMAVQAPSFDGETPTSAVVFFSGDEKRPEDWKRVLGYSPSSNQQLPNLPTNQRVMAAAGGGDHGQRLLFTLTLGPKSPATAPATQPTTASASAPASQPATTQAAPQKVESSEKIWSIFQRTGDQWIALPALGRPGIDSPSPTARLQLLRQKDKLWVMWVEADTPDMLRMRSLTWRSGTTWSELKQQRMPEPIALMQAVAVPQMIVLWPVKESTGTVSMHAITVTPEGKVDVDAKGQVRVMSMDLGATSKGITLGRDIAVAQYANSIAVIVKGTDDEINESLFSADGRPNGDSIHVKPESSGSAKNQAVDNSRLVLMMLLMITSLWCWRRQPGLVALPTGTKIAALGQRFAAGLVDAAGPFVMVVLAFGLYDTTKFSQASLRIAKAYALASPQDAKELLWFLGVWVAHVTISEMVSGKSLGKAVFGLKVVALDGKKAGAGAVLLRNLSRVVELIGPPLTLVPALWLVPVITPLRQRIGDIIAKTVVVQANSL